MKPHLLILSWRDIKHPKAGDAEIFTHEMLRRVTDDYTITHLSPAFEGGYDVEFLDGITYVRRCTPTTLILYAAFYYWKNTSSIDLVIEQVNIHQFFTPFYVPRTKRVLFIHQFTREIWKINFRQPYAWVGEQTETLRLQLYCHGQALTVSQSTADDLRSIGFPINRFQFYLKDSISPLGRKRCGNKKNQFRPLYTSVECVRIKASTM